MPSDETSVTAAEDQAEVSVRAAEIQAIETTVGARALPVRAPSLFRAALVRRGRLAMLGGLLFVVIGAGAAGLPTLAGVMLGAGAVSYSAMVLRDVFRPDLARLVYGPLGPPLRPEVKPNELAPQEIHSAYVEILRAHEDIRIALARSEGIVEPLRDAYDRLSELVQAAGRVARRGNSLQAYLRKYCQQGLEGEATALEVKIGETADKLAASAFRQAAKARRQQLDIYPPDRRPLRSGEGAPRAGRLVPGSGRRARGQAPRPGSGTGRGGREQHLGPPGPTPQRSRAARVESGRRTDVLNHASRARRGATIDRPGLE